MSDIGRMTDELTSAEVSVVLEVAEIVGSDYPRVMAADAVLEPISRIVPYAGLSLSVPRIAAGRNRTISARGYSEDLLQFLDDNYLRDDPGYWWMRRNNSRFFNWMAPDFDYSESPSARNWFKPAGYFGGSTNHLRVQGRYLGELHISTDDQRWPTERSLQVIDLMTPVLSSLVSEFTLPQRLLDEEPAGTCGVLISRGKAHDLPGRPRCLTLEWDGEVMRRLRTMMSSEGTIPAGQWRWFDGDSWHRIGVVDTSSGTLVTHRQEDLPYGITARELEVATLVAAGITNGAIARRLGISVKTVARHVEHLMEKLEVVSRVEIAQIGHREGLELL